MFAFSKLLIELHFFFQHCRRIFWDALSSLATISSLLWILIGGFNSVIGAHEKTGKPSLRYSCEEFRSTMDACSLQVIVTKGVYYIWTNSRGDFHVKCW